MPRENPSPTRASGSSAGIGVQAARVFSRSPPVEDGREGRIRHRRSRPRPWLVSATAPPSCVMVTYMLGGGTRSWNRRRVRIGPPRSPNADRTADSNSLPFVPSRITASRSPEIFVSPTTRSNKPPTSCQRIHLRRIPHCKPVTGSPENPENNAPLGPLYEITLMRPFLLLFSILALLAGPAAAQSPPPTRGPLHPRRPAWRRWLARWW